MIGIGVEYGFAPNWTAGIEYNHMLCRTRPTASSTMASSGPAGTLFGTDRIRQDVDLVTVRVNYRFGGPVVARY